MSLKRTWPTARAAKLTAATAAVGLFGAVAAINLAGHDNGRQIVQRGGQTSQSRPVAASSTDKGDVATAGAAASASTAGGQGAVAPGAVAGAPAGGAKLDDGTEVAVGTGAGTGQIVPGADPAKDDGLTAADLADRLAQEILGLPAHQDIDPEAFQTVDSPAPAEMEQGPATADLPSEDTPALPAETNPVAVAAA